MIRIANIEDSSRMAEIQVFGVRCAGKEIFPLDFLFNIFTIKNREEEYKEKLSKKNDDCKIYIFGEDNISKAFMIIGNCRDEDKDHKTFELIQLYVDPLFQRQNIGKQLVNYCINEATDNKKEEVILWTVEKNYNTVEFYKRMGFTTDGKIKKIEFNENLIRMIKKL